MEEDFEQIDYNKLPQLEAFELPEMEPITSAICVLCGLREKCRVPALAPIDPVMPRRSIRISKQTNIVPKDAEPENENERLSRRLRKNRIAGSKDLQMVVAVQSKLPSNDIFE